MGQEKKIQNAFLNGMHSENLESLQPKGTYREAWSAVQQNLEGEGSIGIPNEPSNELCGQDMLLFESVCPPAIEATVVGGAGGGGLPNGVYQFAIQLIDQGGNKTNWFQVSEPVSIGQGRFGDNRPGDRSGKSINIKIDALSKNYGTARIAVISKIGGIENARIVDTVSYGTGLLSFTYRGDTGKDQEIRIDEILTKKNNYIKGDGLLEWQNRLLLFNTVPQHNLDYQLSANEIRAKYVIYGVPYKDAHNHKGLRPNENYWIGIRFNYCDGTKSSTFTVPGRSGAGFPSATIEGCQDCEYPEWVSNDTSERENLYCNGVDFESATDGADADSFDAKKCECDLMLEALSDAKIKYDEDDSPDNAMRALQALNTKEVWTAICTCEELLEPNSTVRVYPVGTFTGPYDDFIV